MLMSNPHALVQYRTLHLHLQHSNRFRERTDCFVIMEMVDECTRTSVHILVTDSSSPHHVHRNKLTNCNRKEVARNSQALMICEFESIILVRCAFSTSIIACSNISFPIPKSTNISSSHFIEWESIAFSDTTHYV